MMHERARSAGIGPARGSGGSSTISFISRPAYCLLLPFVLIVATSDRVQAQQVTGTLTDAITGDPISGVRIELSDHGGAVVASSLSRSDGRFGIEVREPGEYQLTARHLGYETLTRRLLVSEDQEPLRLALRMTPSAIELEAIDVRGDAEELRSERSFRGAMARREHFPPVGSRRVMVRSDPEFRGATRISDVLRWMSGMHSCRIVVLDGRVQSRHMGRALLGGFADDYRAVEFYRRWEDAPANLRDAPPDVIDTRDCSIIALWRD